MIDIRHVIEGERNRSRCANTHASVTRENVGLERKKHSLAILCQFPVPQRPRNLRAQIRSMTNRNRWPVESSPFASPWLLIPTCKLGLFQSPPSLEWVLPTNRHAHLITFTWAQVCNRSSRSNHHHWTFPLPSWKFETTESTFEPVVKPPSTSCMWWNPCDFEAIVLRIRWGMIGWNFSHQSSSRLQRVDFKIRSWLICDIRWTVCDHLSERKRKS